MQEMGSQTWQCVDLEAEYLLECSEQMPDPKGARGVKHPYQAILAGLARV